MDSRNLNSATSNSVLIKSVLDVYASKPESLEAALKGTLNTDGRKIGRANARIGVYDQAVILANLTDIHGKLWASRHKFDPSFYDLDPVAKAARNAYSIAEAMDVIVRFSRLWSPALHVETFTEDETTFLSVDVIKAGDHDPKLSKGFQALRDLCLALILDVFEKSLRRARGKIRIFHTEKTGAPEVLDTIFNFSVEKNRARCGLLVPVSTCAKPMSGARTGDYNKALSEILSLTETKDRSFKTKVAEQIKSITNHRPSLPEISKALGLSPRTLNRRLETTGTSFRELLEQITKERAENLLRNTRLSRADIAEKLGYKDQASFSRALKRWKLNKS